MLHILSLIVLVLSYLIGSLSSGVIFAKITGQKDPRSAGSGSAGATNVLRTLGKHQALVVLIIDILKGFIAVWIARSAGVHDFTLGLAALAVVIGHIYPVFFKFKGGKGVATTIGTLLALAPHAGLLAAIVWFAVAFITRFSSLASLCALGAGFIIATFIRPDEIDFGYLIPYLIAYALVIYKHMDNIKRLRNDTEPKIDFGNYTKAKEPSEPLPPNDDTIAPEPTTATPQAAPAADTKPESADDKTSTKEPLPADKPMNVAPVTKETEASSPAESAQPKAEPVVKAAETATTETKEAKTAQEEPEAAVSTEASAAPATEEVDRPKPHITDPSLDDK